MSDVAMEMATPFLEDVARATGAEFSAVLYGSGARGEFDAARSDLNLLLIFPELPLTTLAAIGPALAHFAQRNHAPPIFLTRAEWARAADVFPLEIADMRHAYRVLRGPDPLAEVADDTAALRTALERELRGTLLLLRRGYAAFADDAIGLGHVGAERAAAFRVQLRALLVLLGRPVPAGAAEVARAAALAMGRANDGPALGALAGRRGMEGRPWAAEEYAAALEAVARAVAFVDTWTPMTGGRA